MKATILLLAAILAVPCFAADAWSTSIKVDGVTYGASPDASGPIGGSAGYVNIVTKGDFTASDLDALLDVLSKARKGQVVFIPGDAEVDLTARIYIEGLVVGVPAGVTLASDRGHKGSLGALLTSDALKTPLMIRALGPGVRITGLRIQGPNPKRYLDHHARAFSEGGSGRAYYYKFPTQDGVSTEQDRLEVDNCDISGFGHSGVCLRLGRGHHIHHNFIHHCQQNGLGYGISHGTASSVVEFNLFDSNRHSIAGTGRKGCGYVARHNVELGVSLSHCFDMHGGRDRHDGTDIAGTAIEMHHNTFRARKTAVAIRGVPEEKCDVHHNWFVRHTDPSHVVRAGGVTKVFDNAFGADPATVK